VKKDVHVIVNKFIRPVLRERQFGGETFSYKRSNTSEKILTTAGRDRVVGKCCLVVYYHSGMMA